MKSEPNVYGIDHLGREKNQTGSWDGVRNYQARNTLRDQMKKGDMVLFYHSNAKTSGVAGLAQVVKEGYPDHTAFDKKTKYYDPKSDPANPRWFMVDIKLVKKFSEVISLQELKQIPELKDMVLLNNSRLSVQPVSKKEFELIKRLAT
jgi:predicted RNA-binding protein with PUA-like domain